MQNTSDGALRVLLVEDDPDVADVTAAHLERAREAFVVETVGGGEAGLDRIRDRPPDCVVSDYELPGQNGIEFLRAVRGDWPTLPFILYTARGSEDVASEAISAGVTDYFQKGADADQYGLLANRIRNAARARQTERRLEKQTQLMRVTELAGTTGGWELDLETDELLLTDGARRLLDLPEGVPLTLEDAMAHSHPDDRAAIRTALDRAAETGDPIAATWRLGPRADDRLVDVTVTPVEPNGEVTALRGAVRDVTARQERKQRLQRNQEFLEQTQRVAGVGGWELEFETEQLRWTREMYRIHGLSPERDVSLEEALEFYHSEDRAAVEAALEGLRTRGESYDREVRIVTADDEVRWVRTRGTTWREDGEPVGSRGTFQDITERKERERALEESRNRYQTLVANFPNGAVTLVDDDFRYVTVGGTPIEEAAQTPSELVGTPLEDALPPVLADLLVPRYTAALDGEPQSFEGTVGDRRYCFHVVPVRNDDGRVFAAMGVSQDVTEQRARERERRATKKRLELILAETDTGIWSIEGEDASVVPHGAIADMFGLEAGTSDLERYLEQVHPEDRDSVGEAIETALESGSDFDVEFRVQSETVRHFRARGSVLESGDRSRLVGITTDVTARTRRERALEKREQILRELHAATREFYPPESMERVSEFVVNFLGTALDLDYASVKQYNGDTGLLEQAACAASTHDLTDVLGDVEPGANPVWDAYRTGEPRLVEGAIRDECDGEVTETLIVPIGNFGVTVTCTTDETGFDEVSRDLVEVVASNARAIVRGLRSERDRDRLAAEFALQESRIDELREIVASIQRIQDRVASSETQSALDAGVCAELAALDRVSFAWVGRPNVTESDLSVTAAAGDDDGYLDAVEIDPREPSLPAQIAATDHELYHVPSISRKVVEASWAKEALSSGFSAVLSAPLVHDDVLYGVLTAYSAHPDGFSDAHETLLRDVASLSLNYSRMLDTRRLDSESTYTALEFAFDDPSYPLQRVAARADAEIRLETVTQVSDDTVSVIAAAGDGDAEEIAAAAADTTAIETASVFGDPAHRQLLVTVQKPFLATDVETHGGRLTESVSDAAGTTIRVEIPATTSKRPLLDWLTSRRDGIELLSQHESQDSGMLESRPLLETLTDRQYDVLNTAYHGGYYETPRRVTGEELARSFGISSPAVYKHLQAAHRKLLERLFERTPENHR